MRCGQTPRLGAQLALLHKSRPPATEPQRLRGEQHAGLNPITRSSSQSNRGKRDQLQHVRLGTSGRRLLGRVAVPLPALQDLLGRGV
eukprot:5314032-Pyramimonas_sp.AAC.1